MEPTWGTGLLTTKLFGLFDATFESQLSKTYQDNLLNPIEVGEQPISDFLSPATINLAPGIGYTPNENLTFFLSPAAFKTIIGFERFDCSIRCSRKRTD